MYAYVSASCALVTGVMQGLMQGGLKKEGHEKGDARGDEIIIDNGMMWYKVYSRLHPLYTNDIFVHW